MQTGMNVIFLLSHQGHWICQVGSNNQWFNDSMVMLADRTANATEPDEREPALGQVPEPGRRAQVPGLEDERTAAEHPPPDTQQRPMRIATAREQVVSLPPIPTPFPDVARHVEQSPGIGRFLANRVGLPSELALNQANVSAFDA